MKQDNFKPRKLVPKSIGKGSRRWPGSVVRKAKGGKKK
jgi:hypothetical protein